MKWNRCALLVIVLGAMLVPAQADAQFDKSWKEWFGHISAGYSAPQGDTGEELSGGWNISGGATYKPREWPLGIVFELGYDNFGLTSEALDVYGPSEGDASVWLLTAGGIWALKTGGPVGFNLQAGAGGYYTQGRGWGSTSGTDGDDSMSSFDLGFNFGAAAAFRLANDSVVYLEAKYHWVNTPSASRFMPINVGFRW